MKPGRRSHLHVVFICAEFPYQDQSTGGFGAYVERLAQQLVKMKQTVTVICHGSKAASLTKSGVKVIVIKSLINKTNNISQLQRLLAFINYPLIFSWQVAQTLRQLERVTPVDIVEGGDFGAELLFYLLSSKRTKVVIKLHTPSFVIRFYNEEQLTVFYRVMEFFERVCLLRADALYSPTRELASIVSKRSGIPVNVVIPYPMPLKTIRTSKRTKDLILYVGKLQRKKGVFVLLNAMRSIVKKFPTLWCYFIGPDTQESGISVKSQLERLITLNGLKKVRFLSALPQSDLYHWYRRALVTAVPSLWENFPNVLLEATMNGSAVVVSRIGGILEMVTDRKEALLVSPHEPQLLAKAIITLIENKQLRTQLTQNAAKRFLRDFSPSQIAGQTLTFYEQVLTRTTAG